MIKILKHSIATVIINRRNELGIKSQGKLAKLLGVSRATISHWESGESEPTGKNLIKLAEILKISPQKIQNGKEEKIDEIPVVKIKEISIMTLIPLLESYKNIQNWLGCPMLNTSHTLIPSPPTIKTSTETFAYYVTSNAMIHPYDHNISLCPGEIVVVDPKEKSTIKPGELALVQFGENDFRIRQYDEDGKNILLKVFDSSVNPTVLTDDIKIIGVIVSSYKNKRKK